MKDGREWEEEEEEEGGGVGEGGGLFSCLGLNDDDH